MQKNGYWQRIKRGFKCQKKFLNQFDLGIFYLVLRII